MEPNLDAKTLEADIRKSCEILESVANQFDPASSEYLAIRDAAMALVFVQQRKSLRSAFKQLKLAAGGELDQEMIDKLRAVGIDPDVMDEEED